MKNWIIRTLGLKGSWYWAKKQMMNGHIVRCKHWSGALRLRVDNSSNTLLQCNLNWNNNDWTTSTHHLKYEDFTDYEIMLPFNED